MSTTTTKTVTVEYDDEGRMVREVTTVVVSEGETSPTSDTDARWLAVDAQGFVWWHYADGSWSMPRINPDNSPIPQPVTYYEPAR